MEGRNFVVNIPTWREGISCSLFQHGGKEFRGHYSNTEGRNFVVIISKTLQFRMLKEMAIFIPVLKEDISGSFFHT